MTASSFAERVQLAYPDAVVTPLSSTNNEIYKVDGKDAILSAKRMIDADVPISYFVRCSEVLAESLPVPAIERIYLATDGEAFDWIVSRFVEGADLAAVLSGAVSTRVSDDKLAGFLSDYLGASHRLPPMFPGFGLYKQGGPRFSGHQEFLRAYADKYWRRARPFFDGEAARQVDHWITQGIGAASSAPEGFQPIVVDSNLRNFIVTDQGELVLLNVPIVGWSTRAHAVAAITAHLRPFAVREVLLDQITRGWTNGERATVLHLEAWTLLGILSFYAVRAPERPAEWRNWGAKRGLRDDFLDIIGEISRIES